MDGPDRSKPKAALSDYLAAERTLLAWIRTGLALMGFGFVVARFGLFLQQLQAVAEDLLGTIVWPLAVVWHRADRGGSNREFICGMAACTIGAGPRSRRYGATSPAAPAIAIAVFLALVGLAMTIYLMSVRSSDHATSENIPRTISGTTRRYA